MIVSSSSAAIPRCPPRSCRSSSVSAARFAAEAPTRAPSAGSVSVSVAISAAKSATASARSEVGSLKGLAAVRPLSTVMTVCRRLMISLDSKLGINCYLPPACLTWV